MLRRLPSLPAAVPALVSRLTLGLALGLAVAGPAWSQSMLPAAPPPAPGAVATPATGDEDNLFPASLPPGTPVLPTTGADRRFFRLACAYNHFTVDAATEAERATDPAVKNLAKALAADRQGLCTKLLPIALAHGVNPPKGLDRQRDALLLDLKDRATGPGFDKAYAKRMAKTQSEIIRLYEKAASDDTSPDVRRYAAETLPLLHRDDALIQAVDPR